MISFRKRHARYSDHIDYLLPSVVYLGTNNKHWSRSPSLLAAELALDEAELIRVFEAFPGLFRKSKILSQSNEYPYSLQARYARIDGKDENGNDWHPSLSPEILRLLYDFIQKSADEEKASFRSIIGFGLTVLAAFASALAAIYAASIKGQAPSPETQTRQSASANGATAR